MRRPKTVKERLLPRGFDELDTDTQRRWALVLVMSGTLLVLTLIGLGLTLLSPRPTDPSVVLTGVAVSIGYGVALLLPYRLRSHVAATHLCLLTVLVHLGLITVITHQVWMFAPIQATLLPILAVQLLSRRAAIGWTVVALALLGAMIVAGTVGDWFSEPSHFLGSEQTDRIFLTAAVPTLLIVLAWFQEGSRFRAHVASSFKSAVLAKMSHELRTPLNGVLGMLQDVLGEELSPKQRDRIVMAHRAGVSLLNIVEDALDLMQAETGGLVLEQEPFDLRKELHTLRERHARRSAKPEVKISLDYPDRVSPRFMGDGRQVVRIVDKLVDNALKFTDRGSVWISVEEEKSEDGVPMIRVRVEDTGIGIPASKQAVVFDKFTQLEDSWNRTRGGTGLGLAVCRELVSLMNGQIGLTSVEGKGSEFWFTIPLTPAPEPSTAPPPTPAPAAPALDLPKANLRTLVVDDNLLNLKVAQRMLERLGCEVDVASNGRQALNSITRSNYDIVFMDVQMPVMDGIQATAAIRGASDPQISALPVVAMTAYAMSGDRERCLDAGMDGYVSKPIDLAGLIFELQRLTHWTGDPATASGM